jgi:hypothetical protein
MKLLINIEFVFKGYGDAVASAALTLVLLKHVWYACIKP